DFDKTLKFVLDHKDEGVWKFVSWLSVPRKRVEAAGSRGDDIAKVLGTTEEFNIHLLGFSENLVDDIKCSRIPGVVGIDSAVPLRIENEFTVPMETPARDPNWFKDGILTPQAIQNLQIARDYVENLKGL
ncbi:hypothetical protein, partial [Parvimonas micra]|uniref:hypothetical protein n=3 Tax=Parvimonas TaxID=543311 RepID=UPI002B467F50